jgi:hypothetical protein
VAWEKKHRPLFCNTYIRTSERLLPRWEPIPLPEIDRSGNVVFVDYEWNLVVGVATGQTPYYRRDVPIARGNEAYLDLRDGRRIKFPIQRNTVVIYYGDGSIHQYPIVTGRAKSLFEEIEVFDPNASPFAELLWRIAGVPTSRP